ncbi:hypothetical protein VE03_10657 [Pseudogymnoascus sp. 23342-1-I1]|nr:hypothetical protein VE03_10657 [Pseudogymnoascus sp. 23342-1-I1]
MEAEILNLGDPNTITDLPVCKAEIENSRVMCITTSNSLRTQVFDKFYKEKRVQYQPKGTEKRRPNGEVYMTVPRPKVLTARYCALAVSSVWRDEAHLEKLNSSRTISELSSSLFRNDLTRNYHLNPMSGTIITNGPLDIAYYIKLMVRKDWSDHPVLKDYQGAALIDAGEKWNKLVKLGRATTRATKETAMKDTVNLLAPILEALIIRFTPKSDFLGTGPVVELPPNMYSEISCLHSNEWNARLHRHKEEEDAEHVRKEAHRRYEYVKQNGNAKNYVPLQKEGVNFHYRSRLCASFPYLLDLSYESGDQLKLTEAEWKLNNKNAIWSEDADIYRSNIESIAKSSGKLAKIKEKINEWRHQIDGNRHPARMIFASYFFWMVDVLQIPADEIVFLHKLLPQKELSSRLAKFHARCPIRIACYDIYRVFGSGDVAHP